jgi:beta-glucosidase
MIDRRSMLAAGLAGTAALAARPAIAAARKTSVSPAFPAGFLWGASTAGHQIEGNNTNSDCWFLENITPTVFAEPSGNGADSFNRWGTDMDLAKAMGLNAYRFSLEWARIEPAKGLFSAPMLDHYKRMVAGAHARGLAPIVTFNHFVAPRWFAAQGGWTNSDAPQLFARFCDKAARHLADGIDHAITFNEPNILRLLKVFGLPPQVWDLQRAMLTEAARQTGSAKFVALNAANQEDIEPLQQVLFEGHKAGKAAIKAVRGNLPVGVSLAMLDDQAVGKNSLRDAKRKELYGGWLELARGDDFLGVQNYERAIWTDTGRLPAPPSADRGHMGAEVYAPSLAGAVRFAHAATGVPILVSEHGVGTEDDAVRSRLIPAALSELKRAIDEGVPVKGYCHWSLIDNFEWIFGYKPKFGLHSVDPATFARTAKPSASIYGAIARRNSIQAASTAHGPGTW